MALAEWSPRRIAVIWALGIVLQVAMLVVPVAHAKRLLARDGPRLRERVSAYREHEQGQERADSVSRAAQLDSARATGQYRIAEAGDTVFAVVGMPSGRLTPEQVAARRASMDRTTRFTLLFWFGTIPLALVTLTLAWFLARRRTDDGLPTRAMA